MSRVVKISVGCSNGNNSWFFDENSTVEEIIDKVIHEFKYPIYGLYELWQTRKEEQIVLPFRQKIKEIKMKEGEIFHFIDLTFTIQPSEEKKKRKKE